MDDTFFIITTVLVVALSLAVAAALIALFTTKSIWYNPPSRSMPQKQRRVCDFCEGSGHIKGSGENGVFMLCPNCCGDRVA